MDRGNIFSGSSFRATLYGTLVFLAIMASAGLLAHRYIERQLTEDLRSQIEAGVVPFESVYREAGPEALVETMTRMAPGFSQTHRIIALFDEAGNQIAGNREVSPDFNGWMIQSVADVADSPDSEYSYYLTRIPLGDFIMVIGRDMRFLDRIERTLVQALIAIGALMTLVFITIGYRMSRAMQIKLEHMDDTLERVAEGDNDVRLPVSPVNDQIDRVSRTMNIHLDHLSDLMQSTKSSAVSVAHDLKRPLARAFLGLERVLSEDQLTDRSRAHIEDTRDELVDLNAIFETILRIAKIDAAQGSQLNGSVELAKLAAELGETYEVVAEESGQTLVLEIEENLPLLIQGDDGMVGQLIVNLLQNAITHCPPGTFITLGVRGTSNQVLVSVSDTGPGIPEAERDRVFDAFFRTDAERTTEGSGLGMALVKSIANRHGATISLEDNAPGLRVTVTFSRQQS